MSHFDSINFGWIVLAMYLLPVFMIGVVLGLAAADWHSQREEKRKTNG